MYVDLHSFLSKICDMPLSTIIKKLIFLRTCCLQKLNKALFSEIKGRISGLAELTSLPSYLQENRGFKAGGQTTDYTGCSVTDDFAVCPQRHWDINELILFVDNEDSPRIPKRIFDDACQIKVGAHENMFITIFISIK
jgi:hypothetical protein